LIRLYSGPLSLFSRKVEIALHEKNLPFERVMAPFSQTGGYSPKLPEVVAANPKKQVPVLSDGGTILYDSTVILEYLEDAYPSPALYPASPTARAGCRQLELFADEIMLEPLRALMHRTAPRSAAANWAEAEAKASLAEDVLRQHYRALDAQLGGRAFFCDDFSVADIALFMSTHYGQRLGGPSLRDCPSLLDWYARLGARPAFAGVVAEIRDADLALSQPVEGAYPDSDAVARLRSAARIDDAVA